MKVKVVIRKKEGLVYEGEVDSLSSINKIGPFDILPEHTNFVGLIDRYVIVRVDGQEKKWDIERGVLSVKEGVVEAYLGV